jgi:hypothetical protein
MTISAPAEPLPLWHYTQDELRAAASVEIYSGKKRISTIPGPVASALRRLVENPTDNLEAILTGYDDLVYQANGVYSVPRHARAYTYLPQQKANAASQ